MPDPTSSKILIVDDTKTNIDVLIQALRNEYRLGVALTGEKALDYCRSQHPDLVLLDILMPEMDGFTVCRHLKADPATREIPIIFITAMDSPAHKTRGFAEGAVDYIVKPFDIPEVKARVRTHLTLRQTQRALRDQNALLEEKVRQRSRELAQMQEEIVERLERAARFREQDRFPTFSGIGPFCRLLAQAAGCSEREAGIIGLAGAMHDVGKIGIPDDILAKPEAALTETERETLAQHTVMGARLLSGSSNPLLKTAEEAALTHHERWDGKGYPHGLAGAAIPSIGRIVAVCDAFHEALSRSGSMDAALSSVRLGAGTRFDPELVDRLIERRADLVRLARENRIPTGDP